MSALTNDERELFTALISAAGRLATVSDQAATLLSEEFDDMVRPSVDAVREILARCPQDVTERAWDGTLHAEDLKIETYDNPHYGNEGVNSGVEIVHLPTGIGRKSHSKRSQLQNREIAMENLRKAVEQEMKSRAG